MDLPKRKTTRLQNYDYSQNGAYFITICTKDRKKILSNIIVGTGLTDARGRASLRGCPIHTAQPNCGDGTTDARGRASLRGCPQNPGVELLWHGEIADRYIRQMDAFYEHLSVDQYVIMPDHIHLLITIHGVCPRTDAPARTSAIARFVGALKRFCNKEYGENIWQPRFYDHIVRNQEDYNEILEYIENNPLKWGKGV